MNQFTKNLLTRLSPILGAGTIGVCPLCWIGSASLLTYLGLGHLFRFGDGLLSVLLLSVRWVSFGLPSAQKSKAAYAAYRWHGSSLYRTLCIRKRLGRMVNLGSGSIAYS